jgi:hypothetical protein
MPTARNQTVSPPAPPSASRLGTALRKLLTFLCGLTLFVGVVSLLAIWAVGRFAPKLLDSTLSSKTGARLSVEDNETNLFAGRVVFKGLTITNPTRWQERAFLRVRRFALDFETLSFLEGGSRTVNEAELDIEHLVIVGKTGFLSDNNAKDIGNGLKGAEQAEVPRPVAGPPAPRQPFRIRHLLVRVDRITVITGDGTPGRRVVIDRAFDYKFEARDITDRNFDDKVSSPMGKLALETAVEKQPEVLMDLARERVRRSVTEKLLGEK